VHNQLGTWYKDRKRSKRKKMGRGISWGPVDAPASAGERWALKMPAFGENADALARSSERVTTVRIWILQNEPANDLVFTNTHRIDTNQTTHTRGGCDCINPHHKISAASSWCEKCSRASLQIRVVVQQQH
jgi:hypothetical protein